MPSRNSQRRENGPTLSPDDPALNPATWATEQPRSGVYALWLRDELQYIGASKSINSRMYIHECARRYGPTSTGYAQVIPFDRATYFAHPPGADMRKLERALIAKFEPPHNKQNTSRSRTPKAPEVAIEPEPEVMPTKWTEEMERLPLHKYVPMAVATGHMVVTDDPEVIRLATEKGNCNYPIGGEFEGKFYVYTWSLERWNKKKLSMGTGTAL